MEIDLRALSRFHEMAREGAREAASRLTEFTGVTTDLGVTKVKFVTTEGIRQRFDNQDTDISVSSELAGGPGGHSVIVIDETSAKELTDAVFNLVENDELTQPDKIPDRQLVGDGVSLETEQTEDLTRQVRQAALTEVSNMLGCAFVDGWADVLNTDIDVQPPQMRGGQTSREVFGDLDNIGNEPDIALMFETEINVVDTQITFAHFLFPSLDELDEVMASPSIDGFEFEKIIGFDAMVEEGARKAAENMTTLTGVDTSVEVRNLNFVKLDRLSDELPDEEQLGVAFEFTGLPSGYLLFLFDKESAEEIVDEMVPETPDDPFGEVGQSAIKEIGNILSSRIIDGWANVLNTEVEHTPPDYVRDSAPKIADKVVGKVAENQDYAFQFDTQLVADDKEYNCSIYSVCDHGDLEEALTKLRMEDLHLAKEIPSDISIEEIDENPESIAETE